MGSLYCVPWPAPTWEPLLPFVTRETSLVSLEGTVLWTLLSLSSDSLKLQRDFWDDCLGCFVRDGLREPFIILIVFVHVPVYVTNIVISISFVSVDVRVMLWLRRWSRIKGIGGCGTTKRFLTAGAGLMSNVINTNHFTVSRDLGCIIFLCIHLADTVWNCSSTG